jgi:hypothetical protein
VLVVTKERPRSITWPVVPIVLGLFGDRHGHRHAPVLLNRLLLIDGLLPIDRLLPIYRLPIASLCNGRHIHEVGLLIVPLLGRPHTRHA